MIQFIRDALVWLSPVSLAGAGFLARLLLVERGKLRIAQQAGDQEIRQANSRLLIEIIDRLEQELLALHPVKEAAQYLREGCGHIKALIRAETGEDWRSAERNALRFLDRHDPGELGVELPSQAKELK